MDAELTLRFAKLVEEDQRLLCVVLNHQYLRKPVGDTINQLSEEGANWLVDYETQLLKSVK